MSDTSTTKSGGRDDPVAATLRNVTSSAARMRRARRAYRAALVAAVALLEAEGARDPYARVAAAAGIRRQVARRMVERYRDSVD